MSALGMPGRLNETGKWDPKMGSCKSQLSASLIKQCPPTMQNPSKPHSGSAKSSLGRNHKDVGHVREGRLPCIHRYPKTCRFTVKPGFWAEWLQGQVPHAWVQGWPVTGCQQCLGAPLCRTCFL